MYKNNYNTVILGQICTIGTVFEIHLLPLVSFSEHLLFEVKNFHFNIYFLFQMTVKFYLLLFMDTRTFPVALTILNTA